MYSTALPVTLPALTVAHRYDLLNTAGLLSLHDALAAVPDPRSRQGRRYALPFLLTCFVAALLCNCNHSEAVDHWCQAQHLLLQRLFGPRSFVTPTGSLFRWLFPQLDVLRLETVIAQYVQATLVAAPDDPIALDGKTLRGARTSTASAPHLLAFCTQQSHETLLQVAVDEKTNEIPEALVPLAAASSRQARLYSRCPPHSDRVHAHGL